MIMNMLGRRLLTPSEIELLLTLGSSASFTEAAEALNLTQSGVSRAVGKVEAVLDAKLLIRGKSGCVPTADLIQLQPKLRRARQALAALALSGRSIAEPPRGKIRIAGFRSAISVLLPATVATLISRYPRIRFSLQTVRETAGGVPRVVLDGKADFGLTSVRPPRLLRAVHLGGDHYVVIRSKKARHNRIPKRECLVLWNEKCSDRVPEILKANGWFPVETMLVDSDLAVMAMVEQDAGFAILPNLATEPLSMGLERLTLQIGFRRDIWLCGRPEVWDTAMGVILRRKIMKDVSARLTEGEVSGRHCSAGTHNLSRNRRKLGCVSVAKEARPFNS